MERPLVGSVRPSKIFAQSLLHHLKMSSNFWLDSEDEWDDDIYSSDDGSDKEDAKPVSKFADLELDDEDDDAKRVTRSAHEKSWEELTKSIKLIRNKMNINDWNVVSDGTLQARKTTFRSWRLKRGRLWLPVEETASDDAKSEELRCSRRQYGLRRSENWRRRREKGEETNRRGKVTRESY